ncbi:MAG: cob(I)yrinic acid a,c-diamide adenosyltransferase [Pseudomonadota bacterium]
MGNRLSKIVTRTGDDGSTGLADGTRVAKNSARIHVLGSIDELNSQLGLLLSEVLPQDVRDLLEGIQQDLFDLGAALAYPPALFSAGKLNRLDQAIEHYNAALPALKEFILPGGTRAGALCHVTRTVARRAERDWVTLLHAEPMQNDEAEPGQPEQVPLYGLPYLNRLSDLLFVLSRKLNRAAEQAETPWARD